MRSMKRQRLFGQAVRTVSGAACVFLGAAVLAPSSRAVNLFINRSFVVPNEAHTGKFSDLCSYTSNHFVCTPAGDANGFPDPNDNDISNNPQVQFDQLLTGTIPDPKQAYAFGSVQANYMNSSVFLCASIGYDNETTTALAVDMVEMEIFQFHDAANPLDQGSTPPLRTFFIDAPGYMNAGPTNASGEYLPRSDTNPGKAGYCVLFDGGVNVQGELGKINGQYGFRITVQTNVAGASGNIVITTQRAYPGAQTTDSNGNWVNQQPVTVDVTDIHVVRSCPTVVGLITGVEAEPYNLTYRLSKDALMTITLQDLNLTDHYNYYYDWPFPNVSGPEPFRTLVAGLARVGEGQGAAPVLNGDFWNGRDDTGNLMPPGNYVATLQAVSYDQFGTDLSAPTTRQIALDPLIATDVRTSPLLGGSTSLALISYVLTEPATVYIDIYPPNTQFKGSYINDVNYTAPDLVDTSTMPVKDFGPNLNGQPVTPVRHFQNISNARTTLTTFWDGTDNDGSALCTDGDYVYVIYAALPSARGQKYNNSGSDRRIWTSQAKTGVIGILRGRVGISQVSPVTTTIGSAPAVAGINPYVFGYGLSRNAIVNMGIYDNTGLNLVKTLLNNTEGIGLFANQQTWQEPINDAGRWVSSGTYIVQLTAADPLCPMKVSTVSASFPVNPYRITDLQTTPLLPGSTAAAAVSVSYQLAQPMNIALNIYPPGTTILNTATTWPPCGLNTGPCSNVVNSNGQQVSPIRSITGMRPGRMKITEYWDGHDPNGEMQSDGSYVFTLAAQSTTTPQYFAVDRTFGSLTIGQGSIIFTSYQVTPDEPKLYNSSVTITLPPYTVSYALSRQSSVTIQVINTITPGPQVLRTLISGFIRDGGVLEQDVWDGKDDNGNFMANGSYVVRTVAYDPNLPLTPPATAQITISYDPLRIFDVAIAPLSQGSPGAQIFYQVSETMKVSIKIYRPGTFFDSSTGAPIPPDNVSLVKRIVGVRPALTPITDTWDGTDLRQGLTTDGTYKFKIVGSTAITAIDNLTGNVLSPSALSEDQLVNDIPVVRNDSLNPKGDFVNNTYVYPNPVTGESANFVIYTPFQGVVMMRLYTMDGELVLEQNFGECPANQYVIGTNGFAWNRRNQAGRRVARGVYYAVIRVEETLGGQSVLQTVKRILVK